MLRYNNLKLIPSKSAAFEMIKLGISIHDCLEILEEGYEPRKRGKNTTEKWLNVGKKVYNVVIVQSYNFLYKEDVYLITHVGRFTKKGVK